MSFHSDVFSFCSYALPLSIMDINLRKIHRINFSIWKFIKAKVRVHVVQLVKGLASMDESLGSILSIK